MEESLGPAGQPSWPGELGVHSPLEGFSSYRGDDWSPERLAFHQNLMTFAERVGLIVGLQSNGKMSQDEAFAEIRQIWNELKESKKNLLNSDDPAGS